MENIFIVLATLLFYKQIFIDKEYKYLAYSLIIAFIGSNFIILFGFRNYIDFKDISTQEEKNETIVLLVSEGESENYNVRERATQIYYDAGTRAALTATKDIYDYKRYYEEVGSSNFKEEAEEVALRLRNKLNGNYRVVNSYLYSAPYFEKSLEDIVSRGYKNIIICPMFMTEGRDFEIFKNRYDKLNLSKYGLERVEILDTFYKSNKLATLYKNEILNNVKNKDNDIGVLMVGLNNKNNLEQDILFREKIQDYLSQEEKNNIQIKLPLLENNKKDIIKSGEELLEYGIDELYVVLPTCMIDTVYIKHLAQSIFKELDMGNTKFYYINPKNKVDAIVDELFTKISLVNQIGG